MKKLMAELWDQVQKTPDGSGVMFTDKDIEFLWHCGFVDTQQVPFAQWAAFFVPFLHPDAKVYVLSRANFMLIEDFRYKGPIREPFDYRKINEGHYTEQGLDELFNLGVGPSIEATPQELAAFVAEIKKMRRDKNNLIRMDHACKQKIGQFMESHPSPLRRLELIMSAKAGGVALSPESFRFQEKGFDAVASMQASAFSVRPSTVAVAKTESLDKIRQSKEKPAAGSDKDTVPLHKIRRNPQGTRS